MPVIENVHRFSASKESLWKVARFEGVALLGVEEHFGPLTITGSGEGAIRDFETAEGNIVEILDMVDEDRFCYRFSLLDAGPLPYANYSTFMRVSGLGKSQSVLYYHTAFTSVGIDDTAAAVMERQNLDLLVMLLEAAIQAGKA